MPDNKVPEDQLTVVTSLNSTDYIRAVRDPGSTPESVNIALQNLSGGTTQWIAMAETWAQVSSYVFTVSSGSLTDAQLLLIYRKGAKVKYNDGAVDYGTILSAVSAGANSITVTLFGNTDYAMAATSITGTYLSYSANPESFPHTFNYAPAWTGGTPSIGNGTLVGRFSVIGGRVVGMIRLVAGSTTTFGSGGAYSLSLPAVSAAFTNGVYQESAAFFDASPATFYLGVSNINPGNITCTIALDGTTNLTSTNPVTMAQNDVITAHFDYSF